MTTEELRTYSLLVILAGWVRASGHPTVPVRGHSARPAVRKCLLSFWYSYCALIPPTVPVHNSSYGIRISVTLCGVSFGSRRPLDGLRCSCVCLLFWSLLVTRGLIRQIYIVHVLE
jgi:hypothetical protein